jgi:proteasome lid subunit RPN8/RPN11
MNFFIRLSIRAFVARRSRVRITPDGWRELLAELRQRGRGERESGAFLLAEAGALAATRVARVVYFDDVDPTCLTGGITIQSSGFTALWKICAEHGMRVIADVHTHPSDFVNQSDIDRANPMIATRGHVAIIVPRFASQVVGAAGCGVHVYRGAHEWDANVGVHAARVLYIGRWA